MVVPDGVAADAVLCQPGGPFRVRFCRQSLAFSSRRGDRQLGYAGLAYRFVSGFGSNLLCFPPGGGGRQLGYAGLACRFVCGFVRNLLRFSSGGGGRQLGYAGLACRSVGGVVSTLLRFPQGGGPANLVTRARRAVSLVVLSAISSLAGLFQAHFWCARGRGTTCTGDAGLGAPGTRD